MDRELNFFFVRLLLISLVMNLQAQLCCVLCFLPLFLPCKTKEMMVLNVSIPAYLHISSKAAVFCDVYH